MSKRKMKLGVFYGTRPEFLKLLAVINTLKDVHEIEVLSVSTGQHVELLEPIEKEFDFVPDERFEAMSQATSLGELYGFLQEKLFEYISTKDFDLIMAQGDTATVLATAMAAYLNHTPFAHLEAGMRTNNKYSPFPEEINRRLSSHIADLHFCWTDVEKDNLLREGIDGSDIFVTGNTLLDTLKETYVDDYDFSGFLPKDLLKNISERKKIILITQHRRENMGESHLKIFKAIQNIIENDKRYVGVYPVHYNPKVRESAHQFFKNVNGIYLIEPLPYKPFINVMARSSLVITDSGSLQEEAPSFGVPVLITREYTERPLVLENKKAFLVSDDAYKIIESLKTIEDNWNYDVKDNPYGDGMSAKRVVEIICERYL
jgi:UDP-N-acetylglucosamine 2-epimerase